MTHDNPCFSATKQHRRQDRPVKRSEVKHDQMAGASTRTQRISPRMNQHSDQSLDSVGNSRRESPNTVLYGEDESIMMLMPSEACRGSVQRKHNQYFTEQQGLNKKHRYSMKNNGNAQRAGAVFDCSDLSRMPYFSQTNTSSPPRIQVRRYSPPQLLSTTFFAGSKFDDAPPPAKLPPPPEHWLSGAMTCDPRLELTKEERCVDLTSGLKFLLKVQ